MVLRVKSHRSLSLSLLFTQNIPHLYSVISELKWKETEMRKRNSIQCPNIDENQCRINTIHLTVGEGG